MRTPAWRTPAWRQEMRAGAWHKQWLVLHSARTALAAVISAVVARILFHLPEAYWAPITTLVITQSSLGAAFQISAERFVGTAFGALVGAAAAGVSGPILAVFGGSIFFLGLLCGVTRQGPGAYRFGSVTVAIVLLVPRTAPAWLVAEHRFTEVSIGIAVALLLSVGWPEIEDHQPISPDQRSDAPQHAEVASTVSVG